MEFNHAINYVNKIKVMNILLLFLIPVYSGTANLKSWEEGREGGRREGGREEGGREGGRKEGGREGGR